MLTDADTVADAHPELQAAKAELPHFKVGGWLGAIRAVWWAGWGGWSLPGQVL